MIQQFKIENLQDVENVLRYVIEPQGLSIGMGFHPDDDFCDYVKNNGERAFSDEDAATLNKYINDCFTICEQNNADIYEIGLDILKELCPDLGK